MGVAAIGASQGAFGVFLGMAGIPCKGRPRGLGAAGRGLGMQTSLHCRDTLQLGTGEYSAVGHCWDTLLIVCGRRLGSGGIICDWTCQGCTAGECSAVEHYTNGEENIDLVKPINPRVRIGNMELHLAP